MDIRSIISDLIANGQKDLSTLTVNTPQNKQAIVEYGNKFQPYVIGMTGGVSQKIHDEDARVILNAIKELQHGTLDHALSPKVAQAEKDLTMLGSHYLGNTKGMDLDTIGNALRQLINYDFNIK